MVSRESQRFLGPHPDVWSGLVLARTSVFLHILRDGCASRKPPVLCLMNVLNLLRLSGDYRREDCLAWPIRQRPDSAHPSRYCHSVIQFAVTNKV